MTQKFVILGMPRCGSGYLYTMLNSHSQMVVHGELFMPRTIGATSGKLKRARLSGLDWLDYDFREKYPLQFLENVMDFDPEVDFAGFKIFFPQNQEVLEYVIRSSDYKKLVLKRDNYLAMYSSSRTAKVTRQGKVKKGEEPKRVKITFEIKDFERFQRRMNRYFKLGYSLLEKYNSHFMEVRYKELKDRDHINNVLDYLGAYHAELESDVVKRNPSHILDRFNNPEDVVEYMKKIGRQDWLYE